MLPNNNIPSDKEIRLITFLNKEADHPEISNQELVELDELITTWESTGNHFSYSAANPDEAWNKLLTGIEQPEPLSKSRFLNFPLLKVAAMVVLTIGISFATYRIINNSLESVLPQSKANIVSTIAHPNNLTAITLPDGTVVKLNANTKFEYPESFGADSRKVKLSGEAFFEVVKDATHPFIIETENASVEVLGTSFNVSAYPDARLVEVNVETGRVKLTQNMNQTSTGKSTILPAGEHGWLNVSTGELGLAPNLKANYSSWYTRRISFQRTPLAEAFAVLENTYHVQIEIKNPEIGRLSYTANFADSALNDIIQVIARTHQLKVTKEGNKIIFEANGK